MGNSSSTCNQLSARDDEGQTVGQPPATTNPAAIPRFLVSVIMAELAEGKPFRGKEGEAFDDRMSDRRDFTKQWRLLLGFNCSVQVKMSFRLATAAARSVFRLCDHRICMLLL